MKPTTLSSRAASMSGLSRHGRERASFEAGTAERAALAIEVTSDARLLEAQPPRPDELAGGEGVAALARQDETGPQPQERVIGIATAVVQDSPRVRAS
jgi:hypothetical protein